ncbi:MAG: amidohydrolase [Denitrovibrio sp.]|nr:MAG: amidohydrolase [Denitrovibrio sp.]
MALYLKNATFIDWQTFAITKTNIKVTSNDMNFVDDIPTDAEVFDCKGKLVTKSFCCGHHHIYSTLARGMPAPKKIPENFNEILTYIWWTLDKCLDRDMIEASALASAMYCAKNGVTFVIDHHASPFAVEGSLSIIADAFDKIGISHLLCYELSDRDGQDIAQAGLDEHERFLSAGGQGHIGLHASFTVGSTLLKQSVELANKFNTGLHVHTAEAMADQEACVKDHGKRVVQRLNDAGAMELAQTILIHCVHLDKIECGIVRGSGRWIVENIESNQNNNVGQANYNQITDKVMLGTDGMHSDMLRSAKAAFLAGQAVEGLGMDGAYNRFRNIHKYIAESGFKGDGDNNLVVLDYNSPTEVTSDNFIGHFIYGLDSSHVSTVISNGEIIVKDGLLTKANETDITSYAREMGNRLWDKMK